MDSINSDPPFEETYKNLFNKTKNIINDELIMVDGECELPLIDLSRLNKTNDVANEECKSMIAKASQDWGIFQVVNHGISSDILKRLRYEQEKVFKEPFDKKRKEDKFLNLSSGSYRWGTPTATCIKQLSWSEAFHIPLTDILESSTGSNTHLSSIMEQFATTVSNLAQTLADILAEKLGHQSTYFKENCLPNTCYLRLNRYLPCPIDFRIHGLVPHTDSDFLTILYQDQVGGLQLVKDRKWVAVKPNPDALIINIGDLFQAWSNGVYKSVVHRVVTNPKVERFSVAYFLCPSNDTVIRSCKEPSVYRKFSFEEYRKQVRDDVQKLGTKIGLPRFLIN
ncbi:unnamed protein product [Trifolium pratense]|uniref:Uncharacterized protein n=1 Tax=Trifolium pratense TaxID=57577 RepID=A0ACB0K387_TRIPR|nr:unnamed protein product [Trifolium pratense]